MLSFCESVDGRIACILLPGWPSNFDSVGEWYYGRKKALEKPFLPCDASSKSSFGTKHARCRARHPIRQQSQFLHTLNSRDGGGREEGWGPLWSSVGAKNKSAHNF